MSGHPVTNPHRNSDLGIGGPGTGISGGQFAPNRSALPDTDHDLDVTPQMISDPPTPNVGSLFYPKPMNNLNDVIRFAEHVDIPDDVLTRFVDAQAYRAALSGTPRPDQPGTVYPRVEQAPRWQADGFARAALAWQYAHLVLDADTAEQVNDHVMNFGQHQQMSIGDAHQRYGIGSQIVGDTVVTYRPPTQEALLAGIVEELQRIRAAAADTQDTQRATIGLLDKIRQNSAVSANHALADTYDNASSGVFMAEPDADPMGQLQEVLARPARKGLRR